MKRHAVLDSPVRKVRHVQDKKTADQGLSLAEPSTLRGQRTAAHRRTQHGGANVESGCFGVVMILLYDFS